MGSLHKLSALKCRTAKPGRYSDGGGLYLVVTGPNARSWMFRWKIAGRRIEMGLGSPNAVSLAEARRLASQARADRAQGLNPKVARTSRRAGSISFGEAATQLIGSISGGWRGTRNATAWRRTLELHAGALLATPINKIDVAAVRSALLPIWLTMPETAMRLRGRIERILDAAKVQGLRDGENPARWKGNLEHLMPRPVAKRQRVQHHAAMPYAEVPAFLVELRGMGGLTPKALEFAILTAARHGEVRGAQWDEIDLDNGMWAIPAARMKTGRAFRVPLSSAAITLLRPLAELAYTPFVFPGPMRRPMAHMVFGQLLRRMGRGEFTTHGFRTSFRMWAAERTSFPREVCEACLAHVNPNEVEEAYQRSDLLEKRRELMKAWASYCNTVPTVGVVVPMRR